MKTSAVLAVPAAAFAGIVRLWEGSPPSDVSVDEVVRDPAAWQGEDVSVRGRIQPTSIQRAGDADWRFTIIGRGHTLRVRYTGTAPNTLDDDAEVIVSGVLRDVEFSARRLSVRVPG